MRTLPEGSQELGSSLLTRVGLVMSGGGAEKSQRGLLGHHILAGL